MRRLRSALRQKRRGNGLKRKVVGSDGRRRLLHAAARKKRKSLYLEKMDPVRTLEMQRKKRRGSSSGKSTNEEGNCY